MHILHRGRLAGEKPLHGLLLHLHPYSHSDLVLSEEAPQDPQLVTPSSTRELVVGALRRDGRHQGGKAHQSDNRTAYSEEALEGIAWENVHAPQHGLRQGPVEGDNVLMETVGIAPGTGLLRNDLHLKPAVATVLAQVSDSKPGAGDEVSKPEEDGEQLPNLHDDAQPTSNYRPKLVGEPLEVLGNASQAEQAEELEQSAHLQESKDLQRLGGGVVRVREDCQDQVGPITRDNQEVEEKPRLQIPHRNDCR
mmetsp:Transcript_37192/g.81628  ORF Transcript_37192/g.81628 Transcript_37192/m.81628 type:complete len:251 (-) Transcript_37192:258-1010(-)